MKKRILVFINGHIISGAELITLTIIRELFAKKYDVHCVINGWSNGKLAQKLTELEIPFSTIKLGFFYFSKPLWTIDTLLNLPRAYVHLRQVLNNFRPDVCYYTNIRPLISGYFILKNQINIVHIHDIFRKREAKLYFKILNNIVFKYITVSNFVKNNLLQNGASTEKVVMIKNGIAKPVYAQNKTSLQGITIGIIGQVKKSKGHETAIEAFSIVRDSFKAVRLVIFGDGETGYLQRLKAMIVKHELADHVFFQGFEDDTKKIYEHIDIVIVPSEVPDPLPTSAIEAGRFGKPCIVSKMGGLPEIVVDGVTGYVIPAASASELAEKLCELIKRPKLIKIMGDNAVEHISFNFSLNRQINAIETLIDNI